MGKNELTQLFSRQPEPFSIVAPHELALGSLAFSAVREIDFAAVPLPGRLPNGLEPMLKQLFGFLQWKAES